MPRRLLRYTLLATAAFIALTAACTTTSGGGWPGPTVGADPAPVGLHIPAVAVNVTTVMDLAVDDSGAVEVPPVEQPTRLGWYAPGVAPGEPGPLVMLGHVNGGGQDGVFARLHELRPGDDIHVPTISGTHTYVVDRVQKVPKDQFPTAAVYGDTTRPELRLITCGGTWDEAGHTYEDQIIVYATEA